MDSLPEILVEIISHIDQAISISDAESNEVLYLSPAHERIWGRPLSELYGNREVWIESIHPDDRQRVMQAAAGSDGSAIYDEQYRIVRPNGDVRWVRDRAFSLSPADSGRSKVGGIVEDVTENRIARERLETQVHEGTEELAWANFALESEISERRRAEAQLREINQRLQRTAEELHTAQQRGEAAAEAG